MRNKSFNPELLDIDPDPHSLPKRDRTSWVESSFDETGRSTGKDFLGTSVSDQSLKFFFSLVCAFFFLAFLRAADLQMVQGRSFAFLAERNKAKNILIPARRGIVYDTKGRPLVRNVPTFTLHITPAELPRDVNERERFLSRIAQLLSADRFEIESVLNAAYRYQPVRVADGIDYEKSLTLAIETADMPGVSLEAVSRRQYDTTSTPSLAHVLGYTGRITDTELSEHERYDLNDTIGKDGIEYSYERELHGVHGRRTIEVDALGAEKRIIGESVPVDGDTVVLALDIDLQNAAETALRSTLERMHKKRGVVIITDPRNGGVRALVSLPAYDANLFSAGISKKEYRALIENVDRPLYNRALLGEYPSGSTIKPIVAAAALEEKIATISTIVRSVGGIRVGQWSFPDWKAGGHGRTNVIKAIAESVNTYFYVIGGGYADMKGLGIDRLAAYFTKFGLGEKTGIDLAAERSGFVPTREWKEKTKGEAWYIGDTYHVAIGQGDVLVTPLQVNQYTQYFANGGISYAPHAAEKITDAKGSEHPIIPTVYKKNVVSADTVGIVREGMRATVTSGSARRLSTLPITSAGKTGTAQWGGGKSPHAWFTGWAPYEHPELVITVLVEEGEEGSRSASPVAYDILKWYSEHRKVDKKEALH